MSIAVHLSNLSKKFSRPALPRREWKLRSSWGQSNGIGFTRPVDEFVALEKVSFSVEEGEILGLLGPKGAGKSTLINILGTVLRPDEGEIHIFGLDAIRQPIHVQRWMNRVGVDASFFKQLSALENLLGGSRSSIVIQSTLFEQAIELLTRLGIDRFSMHLPMEKLTTSMQQKVAAARALLRRPRLLLLDEATRGLDSDSKKLILQLIREIQIENGATVIYATQDDREAYALCDRIIHLEAGKLVDFGLTDAPDPMGLLDDVILARSTAEFAQSIVMGG